jgi:hypothetical protein
LFVAGYYDGKPVSGPGGQSWVTAAHGWNSPVAAHDMQVQKHISVIEELVQAAAAHADA